MNLALVKQINGNLVITDGDDENAPLITLHNEYNNLTVAWGLMNLLTGKTRENLVRNIISEIPIDIGNGEEEFNLALQIVKKGLKPF